MCLNYEGKDLADVTEEEHLMGSLCCQWMHRGSGRRKGEWDLRVPKADSYPQKICYKNAEVEVQKVEM